jgi:serine/threonine protein kinase
MHTKITSWYRPPEAFKPGEKTYSSKSDIWSVGIVLLELFNKEPSLIYEAEPDKSVNYLQQIEKNFNDEVLIDTLTRRVKDTNLVHLLSQMININPDKRVELIDILSLDIFHLYLEQLPIGSVVLPKRTHESKHTAAQQEGLTFMIKKIFSFEEFSQFQVSTMFLAVDIYSRMNEASQTGDYKFRAAACLTLSYDLLTGDVFPDMDYDKKAIYKEMWNIVSILGGLLYPQYIYFSIWNDTKLLVKMYPIIRSVENYNNFDLEEFLKNNIVEKNIDQPLTIGQYNRLIFGK